jgi:hypothetical protein
VVEATSKSAVLRDHQIWVLAEVRQYPWESTSAKGQHKVLKTHIIEILLDPDGVIK